MIRGMLVLGCEAGYVFGLVRGNVRTAISVKYKEDGVGSREGIED